MAQIIANQALIMLLLNLVGILVYKLKIVTRDGGRQLSALVLEIVTPVLVVHAYMDVEFSKQMAVNLLWTFGLAAVSYILTILGSMTKSIPMALSPSCTSSNAFLQSSQR